MHIKKVAVLDLGIKTSILKHLTERDCYCKVFPARTYFEEMEKWNPNDYKYLFDNFVKLMENKA